MKLFRFSHLLSALDWLGVDNGADVRSTADLPAAWDARAMLADDELSRLSPGEIETLAIGEDTERNEIAVRAPNADAFLIAAFDDELSNLIFRPWDNIFEARRAEARHAANPASGVHRAIAEAYVGRDPGDECDCCDCRGARA